MMTDEADSILGPDASRRELEQALDERLGQIREDAQAIWRFLSRGSTAAEELIRGLPISLGLHVDPSARGERLRMIADQLGAKAPQFDRLSRLRTAQVVGSSADQLEAARADAERLLQRLLALGTERPS